MIVNDETNLEENVNVALVTTIDRNAEMIDLEEGKIGRTGKTFIKLYFGSHDLHVTFQ